MTVYAPRVIKRRRRTKEEMAAITDAISAVLEMDNPQSVRHVFYRVTSMDLVPKTEAGYQTIKTQLLAMRKSGRVPWGWVSDSTRWRRKPRSFGSLQEAVEHTARTYRRDIWRQAPAYVEIWCESDSIAGVIIEETEHYDVPLMVSRGFSSATYLWNSAQYIAAVGKPAYLYYFGDWDPSGKMIPEVIERGLRIHAPKAEIHFQRIAVTPEQMQEMDLPTKPAKKTTHAKSFKGGTVEIEAIPANQLRDLVANCIEAHLDGDQVAVIEAAEESERGFLEQWANAVGAA